MTPRVFITPKGNFIYDEYRVMLTLGDSLSESKIVTLAHPKTGPILITRYSIIF